jgi:hypothetical protein
LRLSSASRKSRMASLRTACQLAVPQSQSTSSVKQSSSDRKACNRARASSGALPWLRRPSPRAPQSVARVRRRQSPDHQTSLLIIGGERVPRAHPTRSRGLHAGSALFQGTSSPNDCGIGAECRGPSRAKFVERNEVRRNDRRRFALDETQAHGAMDMLGAVDPVAADAWVFLSDDDSCSPRPAPARCGSC